MQQVGRFTLAVVQSLITTLGPDSAVQNDKIDDAKDKPKSIPWYIYLKEIPT